MIDWNEFQITNWDTMSEHEQVAWLQRFVLKQEVTSDGAHFHLKHSRLADTIDANLVRDCERILSGETRSLYVASAASEASASAYVGMTPAQISHPDTAAKWYDHILTLAPDVRARCIYWAVRGEQA